MKLSTIQKRENLNIVKRLGEKGKGGAYNHYTIEYIDEDGDICYAGHLDFQNGARNIKTSQHGVTDQDLLEIVRDRFKGFVEGDLSTSETKKALEHIEIALMYLNKRTEDRIERNVLGTYKE